MITENIHSFNSFIHILLVIKELKTLFVLSRAAGEMFPPTLLSLCSFVFLFSYLGFDFRVFLERLKNTGGADAFLEKHGKIQSLFSISKVSGSLGVLWSVLALNSTHYTDKFNFRVLCYTFVPNPCSFSRKKSPTRSQRPHLHKEIFGTRPLGWDVVQMH